MAEFDYFKQYVSEQNRIRAKIQEEENPIHREHLVAINQMIDEKIKAAVPPMIEQYNNKVRVDLETYVNGTPVRDGDFLGAIKNAIIKAVNKGFWGR